MLRFAFAACGSAATRESASNNWRCRLNPIRTASRRSKGAAASWGRLPNLPENSKERMASYSPYGECATRSRLPKPLLGRALAKPLVVALAMYAASAVHGQGGAREVLVLDAGKDSTAIVLAQRPTSSAQYAALEIQYHLEKITGEKVAIVREPNVPRVPVKIAVGATQLGMSLGFPVDALEPWEFLVAEKDGTIVLAGGDDPRTDATNWKTLQFVFNGKPNGTCRAAFEFLEECCDVHWYLPSEAGLVSPQTQRLMARMGAPIRRRSDYRSTSFYPLQVNGNMFCQPDTPDLSGDNVPDSDREKWRRKLWTIPVTTKDMLPVREVQRWLLRNKVGGERYGPNHSFSDWVQRFGREHPEWFSYKSRERIEQLLAMEPRKAFTQFHVDGEPCLTAPGVFEQVVADARDHLDRHQGRGDPAKKGIRYHGSRGRFFGIVPNDNYVWCRCPTCKPLYNKPAADCPLWGSATGKASSYVWEFTNRVAREVRKTHPDGWIGGIAYHDYMAPPRDFTLEPNVAVTICTYLGNWTPALRETAYGLIRAWREEAKCQWIGLWEYFCYCAMNQYQPMFPKVCPRLLGEDVKRLHELGVVAEFMEAEDYYRFKDAPERGWAVWTNPIWLYLNVWVRFKMWDDTTRDVDRLLGDHYRLFYGPAAEPIQAFFERIEARITDMSLRGPKTFNDLGCNRQMVDFEYLFPQAAMTELRGCVDGATALATAEPFKTRVGWVRMGFLEPQEKALTRYLDRRKTTAAHRPRNGVCYRLKEAPVVDGDSRDVAWAGRPLHFLSDWRTGAKPKAATWFRMGYDDTALYFLVRSDDPAANRIRAACRDRDGDVYRDDCIELHLTFDSTKSQRMQILVNSIGTVQDFSHTLNEAGVDVGDLTWDCDGLVASAKADGKGYSVEVKIPLASIDGAAKPGTLFHANVCRERYSGSDDGAPAQLQAWSTTQGAFCDGKYFGRIVLAESDAWSRFFNVETSLPAPVLYKVDSKNPWTLSREAIKAVPEQDRVRYEIVCPTVETKGRVYAGVSFPLDPPVDVSHHSYAEVLFRKADPDVMLEMIYTYVGDDGKDSRNYFILSAWGDGTQAPQVFSRRLTEGAHRDRPAPKLLKQVTIYAVVPGAKTPTNCDFDLRWIRVCKDTLCR